MGESTSIPDETHIREGRPPIGAGPFSLVRRLWDREILQPLRDVEAQSRAFLATPDAQRVDSKVIVVLVTVAVIVTLQRYIDGEYAIDLTANALGLEELGRKIKDDPVHGKFFRLMPFFVMQLFGSFLAPVLIIRLVFRERVSDYGTKLQGFMAGWWIYLVMIAVVMPFVVNASYQESFRRQYPYYKLALGEPLWPDFWIWEAMYLAQFFFLEFFFRGFMLHALKLRFGCYSIFVMSVPYCMIHFDKPMAETLGAIIAGIALGFMSLKTRSIWMGTALHVTVAVTMDMLALGHAGRLGW
jgi:membrane protease YdiL (CAAX protease family)